MGDVGKKVFGGECVVGGWVDIGVGGVKYLVLSFFMYMGLLMGGEGIEYFMLWG